MTKTKINLYILVLFITTKKVISSKSTLGYPETKIERKQKILLRRNHTVRPNRIPQPSHKLQNPFIPRPNNLHKTNKLNRKFLPKIQNRRPNFLQKKITNEWKSRKIPRRFNRDKQDISSKNAYRISLLYPLLSRDEIRGLWSGLFDCGYWT